MLIDTEDRGASAGQGQRRGQRAHRQRAGGRRSEPDIGVRRAPGTGRAPKRRVRRQGAGGAVRRGGMDQECLRGDLPRTESDLCPRSIPCPRICRRRSAGLGPGQGRAEGAHGGDQAAIERRAGRPRHRRLEAAPRQGRSRRGLHRLLRGQQGPDARAPCKGAFT